MSMTTFVKLLIIAMILGALTSLASYQLVQTGQISEDCIRAGLTTRSCLSPDKNSPSDQGWPWHIKELQLSDSSRLTFETSWQNIAKDTLLFASLWLAFLSLGY